MTNPFPQDKFTSSEELLRRLQERSDDFEYVELLVTDDMVLRGPSNETSIAKNCCGLIRTCTGESLLIHREELQALLNDGVLQRMKIPIRLISRQPQ